jgi:hypothetical protein
VTLRAPYFCSPATKTAVRSCSFSPFCNHRESTDSELLIQSLLSNFDSKEENVANIIDDGFEKHYAQQNGLRGAAIVVMCAYNHLLLLP